MNALRWSSGQKQASVFQKRASQRGQALVLGILLAGIGALAFVRYFSVGQVVGARAKQVHALDAAAYSGALVQARALNMLAYLNRTQLAHQVALAHLVTLGSWAAFGGTEAGQFASGNPPAYLIAMLFGTKHGSAYLASAAAQGLQQASAQQGELTQAYIQHDKLVHDVLQAVQQSVAGSVPDARMAAMQEVLAANYHAGSFQLSVQDDGWPQSLRYFAGSSLAPFLREMAGLYQFLDQRNYQAENPWPVDSRCPWLRHRLRRRGNTVLDSSGLWQSVDTQSFHALRSNRWIGCYYREYPMGWGWIPGDKYQPDTAPYVESPPDNFSAQDFWRWVSEATNWDIFNGSENPLANSRAAAMRNRWPGGGLPVYLDIAGAANPVFRFGVQLVHPGPKGLNITTESAAETFFQRPVPRTDQRFENSNLFHPYWQARLASSGQALVESLLLVLVLVALWLSITFIGRLQDMALQAQHASGFAAFSLTRNSQLQPIHSIRQHFFSGSAHQWRLANGKHLLSDQQHEVMLNTHISQPLGSLAQPGRDAPWASQLREDWRVADEGVLTAKVSIQPVNTLFPPLHRYTAILQGAAHASGDADTQMRVGLAKTAWQSAFSRSSATGGRIAGLLGAVDAGWQRPGPGFDWLSAWAGRVPEHHLSNAGAP